MKKFLLVLGCATLILIILVVSFICYSAIKGRQLDASSKTYVDANIPTIISSWSKNEVLKRASTELQEDLDGQQWNPFYSKVKKLGNVLSYEGCEGQSYISITPQNGKVITARYVAQANFQNGQAKISLELVQRNNQWQIVTLTVDSSVFSK